MDRDPDAGRKENVGALEVTFTREELDRLEPLSRQVVGARYRAPATERPPLSARYRAPATERPLPSARY